MSERRTSVSSRSSISSKQPALPVSAIELHTAFAFFDRHNRGYITPDDLKARLAPLYPQLTDKDFHTMTQNKQQLTAADLTQLLAIDTQQHNTTSNSTDTQHRLTTTTAAKHPQQQQAAGSSSSSNSTNSQSDVLLEAFQLFDPHNRGYVDTDHLTAVLVGLGVTEVTRGDVQLLIEQNDRDKDGKIGLNDFKRMMNAQLNNNSASPSRTASA